MKKKPIVAFLCIQNSCRSQLAEAFGRHLANETFTSCSAGTQPAAQINPAAQRLLKEYYQIDMEGEGQYSKGLDSLSSVDVAVTMGCGVQCPMLPGVRIISWEIPDPAGNSDKTFLAVMELIRKKILELQDQLKGVYMQ